MSAGLRALMAAADREPLSFDVSMYCGGMMISGKVAPSRSWYETTASGAHIEMQKALPRVRRKNRAEQEAVVDQAYRVLVDELRRASHNEQASADEVTLQDVTVFPAVSPIGTQAAGHHLPVARVPLASIDLWWVVKGPDIPGKSGSQLSFGVLLPIG